jgi:KEOPS complex subunit Cgi121
MVEVHEKLRIIGLRGKVESSEEFIKSARDLFGKGNLMFQFFDADLVLGKEHILSAYEHARRAFETEKNISQSMAMEILIYLSGEPQIVNAIKKAGIKDGCERIALVADEDLDVEGFLKSMRLERDDEVLKFTESKARAFGIGKEEISAVGKDRIKDLVLERVAMVDVRK